MKLNANFSMQTAKPPAQRIGVAGWDAKVFSADRAPPMPPAPTVEQLMARQFPPEVLRFYLMKRQAEQIHAPASVEGEVWRYAWGERARDVKLPMPQDGQAIEQAAVAEIAAVEGIEPEKARLYIAQVCTANWPEFVRFAAGDAPPAPAPAAPQPQIPPFLQRMLDAPPTIRQTPPAAAQDAAIGGGKYVAATHGTASAYVAPAAQTEAFSDAQEDELFAALGYDPKTARERGMRVIPDEKDGKPVIEYPPYGDAVQVLLRAKDLLAERGKQYDAQDGATPAGRERSMARTVAAFNALHGTQLTEAQGWSFMLLLKMVRLFCAPGFHADSADDAVAYAALLGEGKAREVK